MNTDRSVRCLFRVIHTGQLVSDEVFQQPAQVQMQMQMNESCLATC